MPVSGGFGNCLHRTRCIRRREGRTVTTRLASAPRSYSTWSMDFGASRVLTSAEDRWERHIQFKLDQHLLALLAFDRDASWRAVRITVSDTPYCVANVDTEFMVVGD
jgi:hypothetical protein